MPAAFEFAEGVVAGGLVEEPTGTRMTQEEVGVELRRHKQVGHN
jgi:hypothetical protein